MPAGGRRCRQTPCASGLSFPATVTAPSYMPPHCRCSLVIRPTLRHWSSAVQQKSPVLLSCQSKPEIGCSESRFSARRSREPATPLASFVLLSVTLLKKAQKVCSLRSIPLAFELAKPISCSKCSFQAAIAELAVGPLFLQCQSYRTAACCVQASQMV